MPEHGAAQLSVTVVRTGGIAGGRREWAASGPREEWLPLVEACPWHSAPADPASRDRFVYRITVSAPRRRATVPESALTGPWKTLVDRVRSV